MVDSNQLGRSVPRRQCTRVGWSAATGHRGVARSRVGHLALEPHILVRRQQALQPADHLVAGTLSQPLEFFLARDIGHYPGHGRMHPERIVQEKRGERGTLGLREVQ